MEQILGEGANPQGAEGDGKFTVDLMDQFFRDPNMQQVHANPQPYTLNPKHPFICEAPQSEKCASGHRARPHPISLTSRRWRCNSMHCIMLLALHA